MGALLKNSGIFDMISNITNPVNQQPTGITSIPVTNQNPTVNMTGGRFNPVRDPRLNRVASRPMFRTSRYDNQISDLLNRLMPQIENKANGGRIGYESGGSSKTSPKFIPMDMESVAKRLFERNLDNLTYNEKQTIYDYIEANRNKKANGGRIGYANGTPMNGVMANTLKKINLIRDPRIARLLQQRQPRAMGGIMNLKMGGLPAEMDLRAKGGFVPIGEKERADDVPARLSKNEFVFTANAVRNAGDGDIRKGAKRMYNLMHKLEAKK
jgi:hypothetical protein